MKEIHFFPKRKKKNWFIKFKKIKSQSISKVYGVHWLLLGWKMRLERKVIYTFIFNQSHYFRHSSASLPPPPQPLYYNVLSVSSVNQSKPQYIFLMSSPPLLWSQVVGKLVFLHGKRACISACKKLWARNNKKQ